MLCKVVGIEMSVLLDHLYCLPAAKLLQNKQGRTGLHMPTGPCVPEVVESKVVDADSLTGTTQNARVGLTDLAVGAPREYESPVSASIPRRQRA